MSTNSVEMLKGTRFSEMFSLCMTFYGPTHAVAA